MANYWKYNPNQYNYRTLSDGRRVRRGMTAEKKFEVHREEVVGGFALAEGVGWTVVDAHDRVGFSKHREGPRDADYALDCDLTATGFAGAESVDEGVTGDWIQISL